MSEYAIQVEDVTKQFGDKRALNGVTFSMAAGTVLGVLGPNGAGKTTTINVLSTLVRPTSGHATVAGFD
ncbi:MAG: ATP-binding cassette domain-containing protein, partial [Mycobacterium sp.]